MTDKPPMGECRIRVINLPGTPFGGGYGHLEILQADDRVRIAHEVLEHIERPDVTYGDGILTIRAINGTISYGIGPLDLESMTHEAVRSSSVSTS
jgi:hypothetical protein